ncbi:DUF3137 domain-containing protein [Candidatus Parabeggiatoa sp. HSG14]|uniref:DUF3137 domain-containing protein n=1 Tax=Candidatus Parabeggiatoa sp. HSG14 TaxID=3055593 RepID=UPI0025A70D7B|nr:DUF3137 domain-containing protein [Thiotrichales bacterium HSG14]
MTNELKTFYEFFLKPNLTRLEEQRHSIVGKLKIILMIYGIFMIIAVLTLWSLFTTLNMCVELGLIVTAIIVAMILFSWETWYLYKKLQSDYGQNFKQIIIRPLVRFVDDGLNYEPNKIIPLKDFHASHFFKHKYGKEIDKWKGEDYVEGTLGKTSIAFSEVNAQEGIGDSSVIIFHGLFFKFNFNLNLKGVTTVSVHKPDIMGLGKLWSFEDNKILLNDPELNRHLAIYSNNPTMANQFFNNNFLHHLLAFYRRIKLPIYLSLVDGKLYLAISVKKNLFEAKLSKPVSFELIKESLDYLRLGIEIVEMVKGTNAQFKQSPPPNISTDNQIDSSKINSVTSIWSNINLTLSEQFKIFYETYLTPKLLMFEKQREAIAKKKDKSNVLLKTTRIVMLVGFFLFFVAITLSELSESYKMYYDLKVVAFLSLIIAVLSPIIGTNKKSKFFLFLSEMEVLSYKAHFKTDIIGSIVKFVDDRLTFGPEKQIPITEFRASMLWEESSESKIAQWLMPWKESSESKIAQWGGEDYIQGILDHNIEMRLAEIHKLKPKKSDKTSKGLFFIFDFKNIDFGRTTIILPRERSRKISKKDINLNLVRLNDSEFEQEFVVYSSDDSIFLLPRFQQSILAFYRQINKPMSLSLVNGKLYMLITTEKDLFEAPVDETVLNFELFKEFFEYLYFGKQIGEELNVDVLRIRRETP